MKDFFKDIFTYHHSYNQKFLDLFERNFEKIPSEPYALFCHVLNAHQIWNARILNKQVFGVHELHPIENCRKIDLNNFNDTNLILTTVELDETISYQNTKGDEFHNQVKDILFHINNHSTHHKAQLSTEFRRLGITPLVTDYIFYKRQQ